MDPHDLSSQLDVGLQTRLRRTWKMLDRRLYLRLWFPHVPLFIAVAIFGVLELSPVAGRLLGVDLTDPLIIIQGILNAGISYTPSAIAGLLLLIMSVGLLARSRLAWSISLLLASISLALFYFTATSSAYWMLGVYNIILLAALLLGYRHFQRSSFAAASLFAFTSVLSVLAYAVLGAYVLGAQFTPPIHDMVTALYFAIVTMSTVGYGDIHPESSSAMLFVVSIIILGITVFATSLSALLMPLINRRMETLLQMGKGEKMDRANHYIIVGRTPLAMNSYRELSSRNQKVTFILDKPDEGDLDGADIVVGDPCNVEVLERAGVTKANAVLALGVNDSENAFVVLSVKDMAARVKTVTVANDAGNLTRMKRVHPNLIIAPQILGGELLAMALTGEQINSENMLKALLVLNG
jgi:voltage-gated potassium channel